VSVGRGCIEAAGTSGQAVFISAWHGIGLVKRKVLTPNDFADLDEVEDRLLGFQRRYEQTAVPVAWRFTRADLDRLLDRLVGANGR
jgi:hypothetical protein